MRRQAWRLADGHIIEGVVCRLGGDDAKSWRKNAHLALWLDGGVCTDLRARSGYAPGFPRERFNGTALLAFAQACRPAGHS